MNIDYRKYAPPDYERDVLGQLTWMDQIRNATLSHIEKAVAFVASRKELPHTHGVYFVFDQNGLVVYVGQAEDIKKRWSGHKLRSRVDYGELRIAWKSCDTEHFWNTEHEEAFYIVTLRPKYNQIVKCGIVPEWWKSDPSYLLVKTLDEVAV